MIGHSFPVIANYSGLRTPPLTTGGKRLSSPDLFGFKGVHQQQQKLVTARLLAMEFCKATAPHRHADPEWLKIVLKEVHAQDVASEFHKAVVTLAPQYQHKPMTASQILEARFKKGPINRPFRSSTYKELQDYLQGGKNQYRGTAWEYRRNGMYNSIASFINVCKTHPLMSTGVIGSVSYLGGRYPFLGAVSGVAILAWSALFSGLHELKAYRTPGMNHQKAEHYKTSGENLAAFLLTASGMHGIYAGAMEGSRVLQNSYQAKRALQQNPVVSSLTALGKAITSSFGEEAKLGLTETVLFVVGLFDNVLLPFLWLDDKIRSNKKSSH